MSFAVNAAKATEFTKPMTALPAASPKPADAQAGSQTSMPSSANKVVGHKHADFAVDAAPFGAGKDLDPVQVLARLEELATSGAKVETGPYTGIGVVKDSDGNFTLTSYEKSICSWGGTDNWSEMDTTTINAKNLQAGALSSQDRSWLLDLMKEPPPAPAPVPTPPPAPAPPAQVLPAPKSELEAKLQQAIKDGFTLKDEDQDNEAWGVRFDSTLGAYAFDRTDRMGFGSVELILTPDEIASGKLAEHRPYGPKNAEEDSWERGYSEDLLNRLTTQL